MANPNISVIPNYSFIFAFEKEFSYKSPQNWMKENWTLSFYCVAIYLLLIFSGKYLLRNHKSFQLRGYLIAWNTMLAIFSFMGACRTAPELLHVLCHHGFNYSICVNSSVVLDKVCSFWTWLFVLSKVPELGDTLFVILRKQPLNFLHYYHHSTVLIYAWFSYSVMFPTARWFAVMNYSVHAIMYSYYALKAARFKVPRSFAMIITSLQLLQMVIGCFLNIKMYNYLRTNGSEACDASDAAVNAAFLMYLSYFVLFARFFYKTYICRDGQKSSRKVLVNELNQAKPKIL